MRILIIGATGMLGSSIFLTETNNDLIGTYLENKPKSDKIIELDITKEEKVKKVIIDINPDAIIHTAAITNVDLCEKDPELARKVHVTGTKNLVDAANEVGAYFLNISTDSVFDGTKGNYNEKDLPKPLNIYAKTKHSGENEALKYKNSSVIRTNIYGHNWLPKSSIAEWIRDTLRENKKITLFKDVYFSPILVNNLSDVLLEIVEMRLKGLFHIACTEDITKLEFGRKIAEIYNLNQSLIKPISIKDLDLLANRPLNSTLNCSKIQNIVKSKLLNVEDGIKNFKELENSGYLDKLREL